jgi:hypothetical protein
MTNHKSEISDLDPAQLDALREQLKATIVVGGAGGITPNEPTHDSHSDSDGWA